MERKNIKEKLTEDHKAMEEKLIIDYYNKFNEDRRLRSRHGTVEFTLSLEAMLEIIENYRKERGLAPKDIRIIDIGAGTGAYTEALSKKNYSLTALELVKHNLGLLRKRCPGVKAYQGNALNLKMKDGEFDISILLGPMYHLDSPEEKIKALKEAKRVTKSGGIIFSGYVMNDYAVLLYGFRERNIKKAFSEDLISDEFILKKGADPLYSFSTLEEIESLKDRAGLERIRIISPDGPSDYMRKELNLMDEEEFGRFIDFQRKRSSYKYLLGAGSHIIDILRVPENDKEALRDSKSLPEAFVSEPEAKEAFVSEQGRKETFVSEPEAKDVSNPEIITGSQAKMADRIAINELSMDSISLCERASSYVKDEAINHIRENKKPLEGEEDAKVFIISSIGNNGADGLLAGSMLISEGIRTEALVIGNVENATWEFLKILSDYKKKGGKVFFERPDEFSKESGAFNACSEKGICLSEKGNSLSDKDIIIDALFGIGLKRELKGIFRKTVEAVNEAKRRNPGIYVISVDVPSGIRTDPEVEGDFTLSVHPDITLTFGRNKYGLSEEENVRILDIGIPDEVYKKALLRDSFK